MSIMFDRKASLLPMEHCVEHDKAVSVATLNMIPASEWKDLNSLESDPALSLKTSTIQAGRVCHIVCTLVSLVNDSDWISLAQGWVFSLLFKDTRILTVANETSKPV